jgi:hypothetical protein
MSYKYTLNKITWATPPPASVACTFRHRQIPPVGVPPAAWTVDGANVLVDPLGNLSAPLEITGLLDGQPYETELTPNCGSLPKVKQVIMPTAGGQVLVDLFNGQTSGASITQFKVDGTTKLASALAAFVTASMNITAEYDGSPVLLEILLPNTENGKKFGYKVKNAVIPEIEVGYFDFAGVYVTVTSILLQHSYIIEIRDANEHLQELNYSVLEGPITGVCQCDNMVLQRVKVAKDDADANSKTVRVSVHIVGNNGSSVDVDVDMLPNEEAVSFSANVGGGSPCSVVTCTIVDVIELP